MEIIEVTAGINGYPENLHKALTGFSSFAHAKHIADEIGADVCLYKRRDGWQLWELEGSPVIEPINLSPEDFEEFDVFYRDDDTDRHNLLSELVACLQSDIEDKSYHLAKDRINEARAILDELYSLDDDEAVVCQLGFSDWDVEKVDDVTAWNYDVWQFVIGVPDKWLALDENREIIDSYDTEAEAFEAEGADIIIRADLYC